MKYAFLLITAFTSFSSFAVDMYKCSIYRVEEFGGDQERIYFSDAKGEIKDRFLNSARGINKCYSVNELLGTDRSAYFKGSTDFFFPIIELNSGNNGLKVSLKYYPEAGCDKRAGVTPEVAIKTFHEGPFKTTLDLAGRFLVIECSEVHFRD